MVMDKASLRLKPIGVTSNRQSSYQHRDFGAARNGTQLIFSECSPYHTNIGTAKQYPSCNGVTICLIDQTEF